jgi:hypothetical protein
MLETEICLCAELQSFSCYRSRKEACQVTRAIPTTRDPSCHVLFARQRPEENSRHSESNISGICTIVYRCQNWVAQFKRCDFSTCDAPFPRRPKTVTTPEFIVEIHQLILKDRRISVK